MITPIVQGNKKIAQIKKKKFQQNEKIKRKKCKKHFFDGFLSPTKLLTQ